MNKHELNQTNVESVDQERKHKTANTRYTSCTCQSPPPRQFAYKKAIGSSRFFGSVVTSCYSFSAMKFGSSPWHRYSSQTDDDSQSFRSRRISSVKVDPSAPMNTLDMAHIVLSSIASTCRERHPLIINIEWPDQVSVHWQYHEMTNLLRSMALSSHQK